VGVLPFVYFGVLFGQVLLGFYRSILLTEHRLLTQRILGTCKWRSHIN